MSADRHGARAWPRGLRPAALAALAACASAAGCGGDPPSTQVLLEIWNDDGVDTTPAAPRPNLVLLSWLDDAGFVFRDRAIAIPSGDAVFLGNLLITIPDGAAGRRRFYGRGQVSGSTVSEGAGSDVVVAGERGHPMLLRLFPLPPAGTADPYDADQDTIPDAADNCPLVANPEQTPGAC